MASIWGKPFDAGAYGGSPNPTNPFYTPGSTYGAPQSYSNTPLGGIMREQNPQLAFTQWGSNLGVADNDSPFNRWWMSQYPKFERGYGLATLQNPFITIDQFLNTLPSLGQMQQQFQMLSPSQRGIDYGNYAPQVRWIMR